MRINPVVKDANSILVVIDMQTDFISGVLGSNDAIAIVPNVCDVIKEFEGKEIYATLDRHNADTYSLYQESRFVPLHCEGKDTETMDPGVLELLEERWGTNDDHSYLGVTYFPKTTFASLPLAQALTEEVRNYQIDNIIIVGLCTDICVLSNALLLRSTLPFTQITVLEDCCAGSTPARHDWALQMLKANCIDVQKYL